MRAIKQSLKTTQRLEVDAGYIQNSNKIIFFFNNKEDHYN